MNKSIVWIPLFLILGPVRADSTVTVPWAEFETLYRKQIEERLNTRRERSLPVQVLDRIVYDLHIGGAVATGTVQIRGRVIKGTPEPIPIFARDVVVTEVEETFGAHMLADREGYRLYAEGPGEFRAKLGISIPLHAQGPLLLLSFGLPTAVSNVLSLEMPSNISLVDTGGLSRSGDSFYFTPAQALSLQFERKLVPTKIAGAVSVDSFTELTLRGERLKVKSHFVPRRALHGPIRIRLSPLAVVLASTLPSGSLKPVDDGALDIELPRGWRDPFTLQYEIAAEADEIEVLLPAIVGNNVDQGEFRIEQTAEARIEIRNTDLRSSLPAGGIAKAMRSYAGLKESFSRLTQDNRLRLAIHRFQTMAMPEVVLDSIYLYASYAEDGVVLGGIRLTMPAGSGRRLILQAVPGAQIWSLRVNGEPADLYTQGAASWVIPLSEEIDSEIELAFLKRGPKLLLEGRLDLIFPGTGLTAREVKVTIGLSERVELIAMDAELQPARADDWPQLRSFSGRPHFFSRPYYRGEGLTAAIYYREPVIEGGKK